MVRRTDDQGATVDFGRRFNYTELLSGRSIMFGSLSAIATSSALGPLSLVCNT